MTESVVLSLLCMLALVLAAAGYENDNEGLIWHRKEHLIAAKEIRRYVYACTGYWLGFVDGDENGLHSDLLKTQQLVVLATLSDPIITKDFLHVDVVHAVGDISPQGYHLQTVETDTSRHLLVIGGDDVGVLYGAYALVEKFGVHFRLYGDIIPDRSAKLQGHFVLPHVKEAGQPEFEVRGLQPFHDFPEGPDWWGEEEYKAITSQISKQRMNFIGLHTYPYSPTPGTGRDEPTVWVGLVDDLNADGTVKHSYPTSYANTLRNQWGYTSLATGNYSYGARQLFEMDCYGSPVQLGNCPYPTNISGNNQVFDETGRMLKEAFEHAHTVGVQTCIGSETPLSKPSATVTPLNLYYSKLRQDNFLTTTQCAECENLYEFVRIEGFVYSSPFPESMPLNTYYNGQLQDNVLSPTSPGEGYAFVRTEGYAFQLNASLQENKTKLATYYNPKIHDHLTVSSKEGEIYARDNGYSLNGSIAAVYQQATVPLTRDYYEGIFTRIQRLGIPLDYYWIWTPEGWEGGQMNANNTVFKEAVADLAAAAEARDSVKAPFKLATCGWVVGPLPDRSLFDKVLSSAYSAITSIDMHVGNTPVDPAYMKISKHDKWAIPWMEDDPGLTAPELWVNRTLEHMEDAKKYRCNGLLGIHWRTEQTSPQIAAMAQKSWNFSLTSEEFWTTWSMEEFGIFGPSSVFMKIDSFDLPRPVTWSGGPGGFHADGGQCSWDAKYAFVDQLADIRSDVKGAGNLDRFDYWLNSFKYMRAISRTECCWAEYNMAIQSVSKETDPKKRQEMAEQMALPLRIQLVQNATEMMTFLLQTVTSTGELGTIMNVLSHSLVHAIDEPTAQLLSYLQHPLPTDAMPSQQYKGPSRLIVTTVRTMIQKSETLRIRAAVLSPGTVEHVAVNVRSMKGSSGEFKQYPLDRLSADRNVFETHLPEQSDDFEYYIDSVTGSDHLMWPAGAPDITQTVIIV